ncbi:MAG TPA: VWA domain-containing protein, partial [Candidatus Acidoferrales bacterium]|nr:VWA domain-containing protein [Candidatus Acidoferrales bacterium]
MRSSSTTRTISIFLSTLLVLAADAPLFGQEQAKISVEANMVTVFATVRDKHGAIVSNLTQTDFTLDEDGHPQTVTYFARENDLPLTVGLLVDTSLSQRRVLDQERKASSNFVDHTLRENSKDQAFVIHFDYQVELLQDFTSSRKKLEDALDLLETPSLQRASANGNGGGSGDGNDGGNGGYRHHGGGTLLYDAIYLASDDMMKKMQGRKAVIVLSDGDDRGSKESLANAIEAAQRANTVVYSILFKDDEPFGSRAGYGGGGWGGGGREGGHRFPQEEQRLDGKKVLDQISKETGGRLFEVSKKLTVDQIYDQIQQELRSQYILGYVPDKASASAGYHKLHLVTKQKDLAVQSRDGYYSD